MEVEVNGRQIPFICREDFIANERAVARPQDLADVAKLEQ
jgi:hypothetical protein